MASGSQRQAWSHPALGRELGAQAVPGLGMLRMNASFLKVLLGFKLFWPLEIIK